jgi:hypothetical protein
MIGLEMENFHFKTNLDQTLPKIHTFTQLLNFSNLRPTIYFSISLKDQCRIITKRRGRL